MIRYGNRNGKGGIGRGRGGTEENSDFRFGIWDLGLGAVAILDLKPFHQLGNFCGVFVSLLTEFCDDLLPLFWRPVLA